MNREINTLFQVGTDAGFLSTMFINYSDSTIDTIQFTPPTGITPGDPASYKNRSSTISSYGEYVEKFNSQNSYSYSANSTISKKIFST